MVTRKFLLLPPPPASDTQSWLTGEGMVTVLFSPLESG